MPKVLLINPPFNISKATYRTSIALGLLSLGSYLDKHGIEVKIIDCMRQENWQKELEEELPGAAVVGLTVKTTMVDAALRISRLARERNPKALIVWGGVHPTLFSEQTASHDLVDVAVFGEGEQTLLELSRNLGERDFGRILGIAFKRNGQTVVNAPRPFLDMDEIPLFNWPLLAPEVLNALTLVPTHTSRGCPHICAFCINSITANRWRCWSAEKTLEDLRIIKGMPCFKDKPIRFWDENFFTDIPRAKAIAQGMIDRGLAGSWETTVRVDYIRDGLIDDNFLSLLKKSGCYLLSYGGESGSEKILRKIDKKIKPQQIIDSARKTLAYGIIPQYSFMVGLPGEGRRDIKETIRVIDRLVALSSEVQILGPQAFRPYPGSVLYNECLASGWSAPETLEGWAEVARDELNYLSPRNFPWIEDADLVESLEAYTRFGAHSFKSALGSTVRTNKLLKAFFILICKIRWKLKFFKWPLEFKLARKVISKL